jgi:TPR repeat protein
MADNGHMNAQVSIGEIYYFAQGVEQKLEKAFGYLKFFLQRKPLNSLKNNQLIKP